MRHAYTWGAILVIVIASVTGDVLLSRAMKQVGDVDELRNHGVGGEELADVLEISRPAADVLVHRARAAFRRAFAGLAGEDAAAPANLAVALPMLAAPAALQALPLAAVPAAGAPGLLPPAAAGAGSSIASGAGPAVGVLGKITAALGHQGRRHRRKCGDRRRRRCRRRRARRADHCAGSGEHRLRRPLPPPGQAEDSSPSTGPCTICRRTTRSARPTLGPTTARATATTAADTPPGTTRPPETTWATGVTPLRALTIRPAVTRRHPGPRPRRRHTGTTSGTHDGGDAGHDGE